jgi:hypothetical protein
MRSGGGRLGALAAAVAAVTLWAAPSTAGALAVDPLLPDLSPQPFSRPATIDLYPSGGRAILDAGFQIPNIGEGPLELQPLPESQGVADCDGDGDPVNDRAQQQNVYLDTNGDGVFDPGSENMTDPGPETCTVYHPSHGHWHAALVTTDLYAEATGVRRGGIDKLTFCVVDAYVFDETMPGYENPPRFPAGSGCTPDGPQGLSVGWYDQYDTGLAGQQLDVTTLPAGNYCLRQTVDGPNSIDELDEANNVAETRIAMDPATYALSVLPGACSLGSPEIDTTAPDTTFTSVPASKLKTRQRGKLVQFGFSSEPGVQFGCSLDGGLYLPCASPFPVGLTANRKSWTTHVFRVRAHDASDNSDDSPAEWIGRTKRRPPRHP